MNRILAIVYGVLAAFGLIGTWVFNILSFQASESYIAGWFANYASSSAAMDIIVVAVAACIFFVVEGRRMGMRFTWLLIPFTFIIALAFTFPLFLAWREIHKSRAKRPRPVGATSTGA